MAAQETNKTKQLGRKGWLLAIAAAALSLGTVRSQAADFFQWTNPAGNPAPYIQAVHVGPSTTAAQITAAFDAQLAANPSAILALQVENGTSFSAATINSVFNNSNYKIKYVFADYEGPNAMANTQTLTSQIAPTFTGSRVTAGTSFVGNFGLSPISVDTTTPASTTYVSGNSPANPFPVSTDFRNTGVSMATESLYPGDGTFRNPVNGNSTAPNIRSAMFTLPIQRLSLASTNLAAGQAHVPYISRFNNWLNPSMANGTVLNPATGLVQPAFNTAGPNINGQAVAGQLLSQNDFRALTLHYRMRGATGYQLLDSGVVGYSQADYQYDAQAGWNGLSNPNGVGATLPQTLAANDLNAVYSGFNSRVATLPTVVTFNGTRQTIEQAGVVWSAITNDSVGPGLAILVSNMSNTAGTVNFNTKINGATLSYTTGTLAAGSHTLLRFTKSSGIWSAAVTDQIFGDSALASRDGIGIPEPTSLSLLGIGALGILSRRRRKA